MGNVFQCFDSKYGVYMSLGELLIQDVKVISTTYNDFSMCCTSCNIQHQ